MCELHVLRYRKIVDKVGRWVRKAKKKRTSFMDVPQLTISFKKKIRSNATLLLRNFSSIHENVLINITVPSIPIVVYPSVNLCWKLYEKCKNSQANTRKLVIRFEYKKVIILKNQSVWELKSSCDDVSCNFRSFGGGRCGQCWCFNEQSVLLLHHWSATCNEPNALSEYGIRSSSSLQLSYCQSRRIK